MCIRDRGLARCVQIDGVRYFESPKVIDFIANRDPDGVISDSVDRDAFPETCLLYTSVDKCPPLR